MDSLQQAHDSYGQVIYSFATEPATGLPPEFCMRQRWKQHHPMAGKAAFQWVSGHWVKSDGNLNQRCYWQPGYWVVIPLCCATKAKLAFGLKADPGGCIFQAEEGALRTLASDLHER